MPLGRDAFQRGESYAQDWVKPDFGPRDAKFQEYPELSIEQWHKRRRLWIA